MCFAHRAGRNWLGVAELFNINGNFGHARVLLGAFEYFWVHMGTFGHMCNLLGARVLLGLRFYLLSMRSSTFGTFGRGQLFSCTSRYFWVGVGNFGPAWVLKAHAGTFGCMGTWDMRGYFFVHSYFWPCGVTFNTPDYFWHM